MQIIKVLAQQTNLCTPAVVYSLSRLQIHFDLNYYKLKSDSFNYTIPKFLFASTNKNEMIHAMVGDDQNTLSYYEEGKNEASEKDGIYSLLFTCKICSTRQNKKFSHHAYHKGVVLIKCDHCNSIHLVADNLKWFDDQKVNIETILKEKSEQLLKFNKDDISKTLKQFIKKQDKKSIVI